jgi:Domain of unknown function (DUF4190)
MSDTSRGHGWWIASDGKWYPPEAWTGPAPQTGQAAYQSPAAYPPGQMPYASGLPPYPVGGSLPPGAVWVPARRTFGLAVASLVCSCAGIIPFLFGVPCILGIIFGFVSRSRIKRSQGALGGDGLALAGIIVGFSLIGIFILLVVLVAIFGHGHTCVGNTVRSDCGVH